MHLQSENGPDAPLVAHAKRTLHRAARVDDAVQDWRHRRARKRGDIATVVAYTGYGSTSWVRVLARVVLTPPKEPTSPRAKDKPEERIRGWRSFTSIPVVEADVWVQVGSEKHRVQADRGGVVDVVVSADLDPGWQTITLSTEDTEPVESRVFILAPDTRFGIVSDVDDTVMVTALPRPFVAAWNTFVLDEHARTPVPGMAVMLERLKRDHPDAPVIYLSTGAWNVAPTLTRFLSRNLYPSGPLLLTDWGPTHDRWFRSGRLHKETNLRRLADEFPDVRWLLVGDDGQHDEEIYGAFSEEHPQHVAGVAIRQLSPGEAVLAGGRSKPDDHSPAKAPWIYAPDGAGLLDRLSEFNLS